ncbi:hypothetical protein Hanom_Chr00s000006g01612981 [Helianthus anomalus]
MLLLSYILGDYEENLDGHCSFSKSYKHASWTVAKLEIFDRGGRKRIYQIFSIKRGVENVYTQKFLYKNYILSTTQRKFRGVGRPIPPPLSFAHDLG